MANNFYSNIDLVGRIQRSKMEMGMEMTPMTKANSIDESSSTNFKDVMSGLAQNLNKEMEAPEALLKGAMRGDKDVDIHDVMTAMAKAEINISVATQVTSKVIQAYDKIMQISV